MSHELPRLCLLVALSPLALAGCITQTEEAPDSTDTSTGAIKTINALSWNGLSNNGLSNNGLSNNGLTRNGLLKNLSLMAALSDPKTGALNQEFLSYVVSCTLPAGQSISLPINGKTVTFSGQIGSAVQWASDDYATCSGVCKSSVSACVIARVNALSHHISLSLRGRYLPATDRTEQTDYPKPEATYFGNIFVSPPQIYACKAPGSGLINRVCGGTQDPASNYPGCVVTVLDTCGSNNCPIYQKGLMPGGAGGFYTDCSIVPGGNKFASITVYRATTDQDNP